MRIIIKESILIENAKILGIKMSQSQMAQKYPSFTYSLNWGVPMRLPVDSIEGLDPTPGSWVDDDGNDREFVKGQPIAPNAPIEVRWEFEGENPNNRKDYSFYMQNGNHRIPQAILNGDSHIFAIVDPGENNKRLMQFYA